VSNRFIAVILSALVVFVAPAYAQNQTQTRTPIEWTTYEDPILGISIEYPKGWVTSEEPNVLNFEGGQTIPLDNGTEVLLTCFIWVGPSQDESSKASIQDYLNSRRGEIEVISTNGSLVIDGIPAYKAYYNNSNSDPTVDYDVVDSANSMKYSLSCRSDQTVFNQYAPIFEKMAKSLNIL